MEISSWPLHKFSQLFLVLQLRLGIHLAFPEASKDTRGGSELGENGFTGVCLWLSTARNEAEGSELTSGFWGFVFSFCSHPLGPQQNTPGSSLDPDRTNWLSQEYLDFICALTVPAKPSWPPQAPEWLLLVSHPCWGNSCPSQSLQLSPKPFPSNPKTFLPHIQRCQLFAGSALGMNELPVFISSLWQENKSPSLKILHIPRPLEPMNGTSVWIFLRGASDSDPIRSQLCSQRDLWH